MVEDTFNNGPAEPPRPRVPTPTPAPVRTVLALRGLTKHYGGIEALRGLNLDVREGEVYGFLGRNGAGKSTALRIIMGITRATAGAVRLFGEPALGDAPELRRLVGYVAQEQHFYPWMTAITIGEFVSGFYPTWSDAEYARLLGVLDVPLQQKLSGFSGGMHAKLALALALAHQPRLLVLDEPTAGMDAVARREFIEIVRDQAQRAQRTTLFSSHLIDEVELAADRVGIVDDGRMLYQGSLVGLRSNVRRISRAVIDGELPPLPMQVGAEYGLRVLQDRVREGERRVVLQAEDPARFLLVADVGWRVEQPSLEDTFVAMVTKTVAI